MTFITVRYKYSVLDKKKLFIIPIGIITSVGRDIIFFDFIEAFRPTLLYVIYQVNNPAHRAGHLIDP